MCTIPKAPSPPPPPPPALLLPQISPNKPSRGLLNIYYPIVDNPSDCLWAEADPDLRRACIVSRICIEKPPYKYNSKKFNSVIQVGPTCGVVALAMLIHEQISTDIIFRIARTESFTNQGEMLSCTNMATLVGKVFDLAHIRDIKYEVKKGGLDSDDTVEHLLNGGALLVPYDADVNHAPALKNGHTAHWCLISGVIITKQPEGSYNKHPDNVYTLSRHGKSKFLSAWKLADLTKSNRNLWEFSPKKQSDNLEYVQPDGGLGGKNGLRSQYLSFTWS